MATYCVSWETTVEQDALSPIKAALTALDEWREMDGTTICLRVLEKDEEGKSTHFFVDIDLSKREAAIRQAGDTLVYYFQLEP